MTKKALFIALTSCFLASHLEPAVVVGDPDATPGTTFSFNVGFTKYDNNDGIVRLWLASGQDITNDAAKSYALSFAYELPAEPAYNAATGAQIFPTAQPRANSQGATIFTYNPTTKLVETTTTPNPIYGAQFQLFDLYLHKPAFVMAADQSKLYYTHFIEHHEAEAAASANKTDLLMYDFETATVTSLLGTSSGIYTASLSGLTGNPSISLFIQSTQTQEGSTASQPFLKLLATTEILASTPALTAGGADLGNNVALQYGPVANMIYAGIDGTAKNGPNDKVAGVMIVSTMESSDKSYSLAFSQIADNNVISNQVNTIISAPKNQQIRITSMANMSTSTSLHYLIVARDNGTGPQSIYAAPIVTAKNEFYGQIADYTSIINRFNPNTSTFASRAFDKPLADVAQIDISNISEQITVGGGAIPLASGDIEKMYVAGDSVYVVIGDAYAAGTQPGTFQSQAIFAQDGHIISWSPWARVLGSDKPMNYSHMGMNATSNFYVSDITGAGTNFNTVIQTQWTVNQNLAPIFNAPYVAAKGGIQGLFNFSSATPGFNNAMSMLATTGFNCVTLGQTGITNTEFKILSPITDANIVSFNDVNNSNAIIALELASNGANHWLFAGGASGVSVLTNDTSGVTKNGNFSSVADFNTNEQTWKKVGNFAYVKKLVWDETFLYVLTPAALYQIALDPNKFTASPTVALNPVTIVSSSNLSGKPFLLDFIIDNGFAILGTTNGIYSATIAPGSLTNFSSITIPDGLAAGSQLFVVSNSIDPQRNFAERSNLYVLNSSFATQQARLNRFAITDSVIQPFNDALLNNAANPNGIPSSFIRFGQYVSNYFADGTWNLASNYFLGVTQPAGTVSPSILQIYSNVRNGVSSSQKIMHDSSAYAPAQFLKGINNFLGIARESTSGACIASGNFQTRINA